MNNEHLNQRQRITLSYHAYDIIQNDMFVFMDNPTVAGFINRILKHYSEISEATIHLAIEKKENALRNNLEDGIYLKSHPTDESLSFKEEFPPKISNEEEANVIISNIIRAYEIELKNKMNSFSKDVGCNPYIHKEIFDKLYEDNYSQNFWTKEGKYYKNQGAYFKAVIEDYALKPTYLREQIFFSNWISDINGVLSKSNKDREQLKIVYKEGSRTTAYDVKPYKIISDSSSHQSGLIGYSRPLSSPGVSFSPNLFRFPRIVSLTKREKSHGSGKITKEEIKNIEEKIHERGIHYFLTDSKEIEVFLTNKGVSLFNRISYQRPLPIKDGIEKTSGGKIYHFNCTEFQAENYFIKFGEDAIILNPESLRNKMLRRYKAAAAAYESHHK